MSVDMFDGAAPDVPKDPTAAERQRRYREKKRNAKRDAESNGDAPVTRTGTLLRAQEAVEFELMASGDLVLSQDSNRPDGPEMIYVACEYVDQFLDELQAAQYPPVTLPPPRPAVVVPPADPEPEDDGESVIVEHQRRVQVFWNQRDGITIQVDGSLDNHDDDLLALHPHEAEAAAKAILRLLADEEVKPVEQEA